MNGLIHANKEEEENCIAAKFLHRILTPEQKAHYVEVSSDLH